MCEAFLTDLASSSHPVVVVLEDLQWADEATLDLLRVVARRLDVLRCLIIATYRDDLTPEHPLRRAWGSLVGPLVTRMSLSPLSVAAVATLVDGTGVDAAALHARTGGNPFFVVEVLAGEHAGLPPTVRDTILARAARLHGSARDCLDAAAVLGRRATTDLIASVGDGDALAIDECIAAGMLVGDGCQLSFRHDLTRETIEDALTPLRRRQLHRRALDALDDSDDIVQRAHHALGAGDRDAIIELATRAADECVLLGAQRQAATLYAAWSNTPTPWIPTSGYAFCRLTPVRACTSSTSTPPSSPATRLSRSCSSTATRLRWASGKPGWPTPTGTRPGLTRDRRS